MIRGRGMGGASIAPAFREDLHPRVPAGTEKGGEFTTKGGSYGPQARKADQGQDGQGDGAPIPEYGNPNEGAVQASAVHYSSEGRTSLSSEAYGTGGRGIERDRLASAPSEIRNRIYFYIDEGHGVQPETSVGSHAHRVTLRNLYDPARDGAAVWRRGRGDMNASEMAVVRAGYDGYYLKSYMHTVHGQPYGIAVLLGQRNVPVKYIGTKRLTTPPGVRP